MHLCLLIDRTTIPSTTADRCRQPLGVRAQLDEATI